MINSSPQIFIIAGPNGAGKSTCGPAVLQKHFHISEFVNADTIATGLSAFKPDSVAMSAGRIMLKRIKQLAEDNVDFAFQTTLSSRTFAPWIKNLKTRSFQFTLYQPLADHWCFLDNSDKENLVLIAEGNQSSSIMIHQENIWDHIQKVTNENL